MACGRGILSSFLKSKREKTETSENFLENGSKLLEEFITSWNGQCRIPIPNLSAEELIMTTNNFDFKLMVVEDSYYILYRGCFGKRPVLVKKYKWGLDLPDSDRDIRATAFAIRDIVITSQMSSHKNVLKLIGCCLEFKKPVLVYEDVGSFELLSQSLFKREGEIVQNGLLLSWRSWLRIAYDIAYALVYLHTAFSSPIIYRNLKPQNVIIDQCGVAKLLDFSLSIMIPLGESQVEDDIMGTGGFLEPQYVQTGILTEKADVYSFGIVLLELLTGQKPGIDSEGKFVCLIDYVENLEKGQLNEIVDSRILGGAEQEQQLQAFAALALRCVQAEREDRPEMLDVAKELKRIESSYHPSLAQP